MAPCVGGLGVHAIAFHQGQAGKIVWRKIVLVGNLQNFVVNVLLFNLGSLTLYLTGTGERTVDFTLSHISLLNLERTEASHHFDSIRNDEKLFSVIMSAGQADILFNS